MREHDYEPVRGLPEPLPAGERILWQGAPEWRALARRALHVVKVAAYMVVLLAWNAVAAVREGMTVGETAVMTAWLLPLPLTAVGLLALFGWLYARTTVYTVTDKRLVVRSGVALPVTVNLPFKVVAEAALKLHGNGIGDIPLRLQAGHRASYVQLWPSARPWHVNHPQPMLRCIRDAATVARILGDALATYHGDAAAADGMPPADVGPSPRLTGAAMRQPLVVAGR